MISATHSLVINKRIHIIDKCVHTIIIAVSVIQTFYNDVYDACASSGETIKY